ncbi:hypothetical protein I4U23_011265 [Adineta vaga]|nr:hypothetical protein I4U23_011265 [Adineta vaga]
MRSYRPDTPPQNNLEFINKNSSETIHSIKDPFENGIWSLRYHQYNKWHGPYNLALTFNHSLDEITGRGTDDVGDFTINGVFSSINLRLDLIQTYKKGTGDPNENLGHTSTIQMTWNSTKNQFEGTWYVQTYKYSGNGIFELRFETDSIPLLDADSPC